MNCEQVQQSVLDFFDHPNPARFDAALESHVESCEACRLFVEVQQALDARLTEALPSAELSAGFRTALLTKIEKPSALWWPESLPDVAHFAGSALGILLLLLTMPQYSTSILLVGGGLSTFSYMGQAVFRNFLERLGQRTLRLILVPRRSSS